ncbi:MAG: hypothetical protein AAF798_20565 [Bacteroidota bacterium]
MLYRTLLLTIACLLFSTLVSAQLFVEKQTRHRFAQFHFGLDVESSLGGTSRFLNREGQLSTVDLTSLVRPRLLIGGTHFWGHADFYIAIPVLGGTLEEANQEISYLRGVETVFKYYPWRIQDHKIRPYVGLSIAPFYFEQKNNKLEFGNGPEKYHTSFPLLTGMTYTNNSHLFELGFAWNYNNQQEYAISRTDFATIDTPPFYLSFSYRYFIDTTISAEESWESGRMQEVTRQLEEKNKLNAFYVGVGLSSAFWLGESSYNETTRPYIESYGISIMPDFTLGYHLHKPDMNIAIGFRGYSTSTNTYGTIQSLRRGSLVFEVTKNLFDYNGFVPFIGPAITYEQLSFEESHEGQLVHNLSENQFSYGLTFGWDIRPNRLQSFILRTNLRWFPDLNLEVSDGQLINFNNLEFNFIQLILYPQRIF